MLQLEIPAEDYSHQKLPISDEERPIESPEDQE
jgi:hypothetical protein